jgi:hypothetical protein
MTDEGVLRKIRALLAKAEATPFGPESEAFTAKAQELITRSRIDAALLAARDAQDRDRPVARRIDIDSPYLKAKVVLLSDIAQANDCRAIWPTNQRYVHLLGFPTDLDAVDELFTSLLVQATAAMQRAGSKRDEFQRSRTKSFRRAFLLSFALRIGQRLSQAAEETVRAATAETGVALVPLLAARADATDAFVRETFPNVRPMHATVSDAEGWHAGSVFAEQADLSRHRKIS